MTWSRMRLGLAAVLFAAWMGWLAYLVLTTERSHPVILSRPQFLVSSLDVIARVDGIEDGDRKVTIREVLWPQQQIARHKIGEELKVTNLAECRTDWIGPGEYILPLVQSAGKEFEVAAIPRSPGYVQVARSRIYPATDQTREQYKAIRNAEGLNLPDQRK
jgi:hypothetical protein